MAYTGSDSSPPSPGAPASAFLDDHALFLDQSSSSFFPGTTSHEPLAPAASASSSAARKPPRKRPRASRRPPTTVVTTDTSNFRAMVQEFTGIPAPPPPSFAPHLGPAGMLFGGPHDPTLAGTARPPLGLELLMRPSPLKLHAAPHASPPAAAGSFAHSLFASSNADPAGPSSEPYSGFAPSFSGAVPRYDGSGGGGRLDAAEDERVLRHHDHGLFSSFLHAGDTFHSH
ncbi:VQ motif-containing protein [Zea mays]|uniref:VQ motif-containing protein n=1 Tax=Zea mays TaxID=4577 RepID=A0A1D6IK96_MAIZE|nr:VQ motif-containing protein [Zea mays]